MSALEDLCAEFADEDEDAALWLDWNGYDPEDRETLDCDVISQRFIDWLAERGVPARLVHVRPPVDTGELYSNHWFVALDGVAVDWTARQFWNVPQPPVEDAADIACPLIFSWPGTYPIDYVHFEEQP